VLALVGLLAGAVALAAPPANAAPFTVTVVGGFGSGSYEPGTVVHVWADVDPATEVVTGWSGDDELMAAPAEWRTTFTMPARDVSLSVATAPQPLELTVEPFRGVTSVAKTVRHHLFPSMRGVVVFSHGTGGSSAFIDSIEAYPLALALRRAGYGVLSFEAEEAVAGDLNGDGKLRWAGGYGAGNVDLRNTEALLADLERRGLLPARTPLFALGMSAGGAWSHRLGTVADTSAASAFPRLRFEAAISYCADATATQSSSLSTTPSAWYLCGADDNGEVSNAEAIANEARLRGRGVPTDLAINPPSPLYDGRFARVAGITPGESSAMADELRAAGYVDATGFLDTDSGAIVADMLANPGDFPVAAAQVGSYAGIRIQLGAMRAEHQMFSDLAARTVGWFERFNRPPTANGQAVTLQKGVPKAVALTGSDPDGQPLTCVVPGSSQQAKVAVGGSGCARSLTAVARSSGSDAFAFRTRDPDGLESPNATVAITIQNRPPTAADRTVQVSAGERVAIALTGTDPDPGEGLALTCAPTTGPTSLGSVAGSGCNVTYAAGASTGTDAVGFTVADGFGGTDAGTVTVEVVAPALPGCSAGDGPDARYVCRVYLDLLGRAADPSGKAFWLRKLTAGDPRAEIIRKFQGTPEYARRVVDDVYRTFLQRTPDPSGQAFWAGRVQRGANPDEIRAQVIGSNEWWTKAGASPQSFGAALYQQVTRTPATSAQVAGVVSAIGSGRARTSLAASVLASSAGDTATVQGIYERYLRRTPPASEVTYWVGRLQAGITELRLVEAVIASNEYYRRA
jgi:hypothetical protein